ncbi:ankyrin repeat-containing domain protein [Morchella snyderi]|nr:ankyrin repeat-containing domain protein [Morchella snyderi]
MAEVAIVGLTASILGIIHATTKVASLSYSYISGVKRAPDELRKLADELKSLTTVLTILSICVNDHGPALLKIQDPLQSCLSELLIIQAKLESSSIKASPGRWWPWNISISRLQWPCEEQETLNYVSKIERFKSLVILTMTADQVTRSKAIETGVKEINEIKSKDEALRIEKKRMEVLDWLYPSAFDKRHLEISSRRQKDTGKWVLREPGVQEWCGRNPQNRLLWAYGIPGAGKTFISSLLIDYLQGRATKANHGVAYIYFNYQEQNQQEPRDFLASILKQLACQLESLPKEIEELYEGLGKRHGRPTIEDLSTILFKLSKSFTRTFIICDALDECDPGKQRKMLLPLFHQMAKNGIYVFLTSREYPEDIQISLQGSASAKIRLWAKDEDITFYIKQKIADNPRAKRLVEQGNCQDKIILQLQKCANGMFLLVHFHIEYLCQQTNVRQILEELYKLENSATEDYPMDPTYNNALNALRAQPKGCRELAFKILTWLVRARRILTVRELQLAVSMSEDCTTFDNSALPDRNTLLDVCASLVMVDEKEDTIRLVHYTVQEYLLRNAIISNDIDSNSMITISCIGFLSLDIFLQGACTSDKSLQDRWNLYPFLDYAAKQLSSHLGGCNEALSTRPILRLLSEKGNIESYVQALYIQKGHGREGAYAIYPKGQEALHVAAALGHVSATRILLESGANVSATDGLGRTALPWAAFGGHEYIIKLLIGGGANVSARDKSGITAFERAEKKGHKSVTRLLENPKKPPGLMEGLEKTVKLGCLEKVELLLKNERHIDRLCMRKMLHIAVEAGYEPVVRLLLEKGADIRFLIGNSGWNALHAAAANGHEPVVRLLLEKGADISSTCGNSGGNALHVAALKGHEPVVRLLLEKGADISTTDDNAWNALHHAALKGHEPVARLLLEKGADISSTVGNSRGNALHAAASNGHEPVARLLLEKGADISTTDDNAWNALHHAAFKGHELVVWLLLEKGADISSTCGNSGGNALHVAALKGHEPVARLLLEKGADISSTVGNSGGNALHAAASNGHEPVARLLLEKGADISTTDDNAWNALHHAAFKGHELVVWLLLEKGADISSVTRAGYKADRIAEMRRFPSIAQLVREYKQEGQEVQQ